MEGTADVINGKEIRPHHYIRSILPEGPIGRHTRLKPGDELLEVRTCIDPVSNQELLPRTIIVERSFDYHFRSMDDVFSI